MSSNSDAADKRIADLERELLGVQEILAFALYEIGEQVVVSKATLAKGLPKGTQIKIDEDMETNSFIFSLDMPSE